MMPEVRVRLSPALYERLMEQAAALQREPEEVVAEAVERWLEVQEEDVETRLRRALERSGLWVPPEERRYKVLHLHTFAGTPALPVRTPPRYAQGRPINREELERRLANLHLTPSLSEDIIAERGEQ